MSTCEVRRFDDGTWIESERRMMRKLLPRRVCAIREDGEHTIVQCSAGDPLRAPVRLRGGGGGQVEYWMGALWITRGKAGAK